MNVHSMPGEHLTNAMWHDTWLLSSRKQFQKEGTGLLSSERLMGLHVMAGVIASVQQQKCCCRQPVVCSGFG